MATEKETMFPVEDFLGIDRQVDREDISDNHFHSTQNLWEKTIGVLETRPGSESLASSWPSHVAGIDKNFRIYKRAGDHKRIVALQREFSASTVFNINQVQLSFVADGTAYWFHTALDARFDFEPAEIVVRAVGYGVDTIFSVDTDTITGYSPGTRSKLRIVVPSALNANITGLEIGAVVKCGASSNPFAGTYETGAIWVGHIDLSTTTTGTFDFKYAPISRASGAAVSGEVGEVERTFLAYSTTGGGSLQGGKWYYVLVAPQHFKWQSPFPETSYRQPAVNLSAHGAEYGRGGSSSNELIKVYVEPDHNTIVVSGVSPNTLCALIAIGEHPQLLVPYGIYNELNTFSTIGITEYPKNRPGVMAIIHASTTSATLRFILSDFSTYDMLGRVSDAGVKEPVFLSRNSTLNQYDTNLQLNTITNSRYEPGAMNSYRFAQYDEVAYFVNGPRAGVSESSRPYSVSGTNYFITDGVSAASVVFDYGTQVPKICSFITKYQESIVVGGGNTEDGYDMFYFSRTFNPTSFESDQAGRINFVQVERGGEGLNGIGIWTAGTSDGPQSKMLVTKKNSLWLLTNLPFAGTTNTILDNLSKKVGCVGDLTIINTPIGTIIAAVDNVYVVRESGEPVPIGDPISSLLKKADLTRATACYHDEQYKLSFYHSDYPGTAGYNNVELWLDIKKMKQLQGKPDWKGPMLGRAVDFSFVEDLDGDGDTYDTARTRYAVDRENKRLYKADVTPLDSATQILDFATPVTSLLEFKDYAGGDAEKLWNKLITRNYWKVRTNKTSGTPLTATETTFIDGVQVETKTISMNGIAGVGFDSQPQKMFPFFPESRIRGRTVRKTLSTTDRIGIGGFAFNYRVERRRI